MKITEIHIETESESHLGHENVIDRNREPETNKPEPKRVTLPLELMVKIVTHLGETNSFSSLYGLQRTSREMYLLATPHMYREIGYDYQTIGNRFAPLANVFEPDSLDLKDHIDFCDDSSEEKHPLEWNPVSRLLWMYSHTRRIVYKQVADLGGGRICFSGLIYFGTTLHTRLPDRILMSNVKHLVVDVADGGVVRNLVGTVLGPQDYLDDFLRLLRPRTPAAPTCVRLGPHWSDPWTQLRTAETLTVHGISHGGLRYALFCAQSIILDGCENALSTAGMSRALKTALDDHDLYKFFRQHPELIRIAKPVEQEQEKEMSDFMDLFVKDLLRICVERGGEEKDLSWEYLKSDDGGYGPVKCGGCGSTFLTPFRRISEVRTDGR